jgi:hypothetical protein
MLSSLQCAMAVPCNSDPAPSLKLPASEDFHMTSRFPGPWRIAEFPNGFAVYDAAGRHLGFFYGRTDPNIAGRGDFLMIEDARQIAIDFAMLPELRNLISGRNEVAASTEDDKLTKLKTNCALRGAPETVGWAEVSANVAAAKQSALHSDEILDSDRSRYIACGLSLLWGF